MTKQIVLPRYSPGHDHGAPRRLIAVLLVPGADIGNPAGVHLYVTQGHSASVGARGFGRQYHPARLWLREPDRTFIHPGRFYNRGLSQGRITKATLLEQAEHINAAFGCDVASRLDPGATVWVRSDGRIEDAT